MSGYLKRLLIGMSCLLTLGIAGTFAQGDPTTSPTTGTITGTVTGVNGPTSGVTIKIVAYKGKHSKGAASSTTTKSKHQKILAVGEGVTDANGNFSIANIPDGQYTVTAVLKGVGRGHARADLSSTTVSVNITLAAGHQKKVK